MIKLDDIIATYGSGLARVAGSYEADPALQEDLLQDVLIAIHGALPSLENEQSLAPFVYRIAHNRCVSHVIRQSSRRKRDVLPTEDEPPATPEQLLLVDERSRMVAKAVLRLPLPYRQVVTLVLEELTYSEIAEALDLTVSNVGVRMNRAKAQLKELLDAP
jgi:RNA polymerase sigma-70 factor (ECF subfamily)